MRRITKSNAPQVLQENKEKWTNEFTADPNNVTKRYRYRHRDIKSALLNETAHKCVYCESKVGHNTPGDVEHKIPTSFEPEKHFEWDNLTIACTECNRRKGAYYDQIKPFLDPYSVDVENRIVHHGPIVCWPPGDSTSEATIRTLSLHDNSRQQLIARKIEAIDTLNNVVARLKEKDDLIRDLMKLKLGKLKDQKNEFSGMIVSICNSYGI